MKVMKQGIEKHRKYTKSASNSDLQKLLHLVQWFHIQQIQVFRFFSPEIQVEIQET